MPKSKIMKIEVVLCKDIETENKGTHQINRDIEKDTLTVREINISNEQETQKTSITFKRDNFEEIRYND